MARIRHILFLVTTTVLSIGSTYGGYLSKPNNVQGLINQISGPPNNVVNPGPNHELLQSFANHYLHERHNEDGTVSTYEIDNSAVPLQQNFIHEQQHGSIVKPFNSEIYSTGNIYLNKAPILSNSIPSVEIAPPILPAVQQHRSIAKPLTSEVYNNGNLYLNKAPILPNIIPSVEIAPPILPAVQQYGSIAKPLNSEVYNNGNLYLNEAPIISNSIPSVEIAPPILPAVQQDGSIAKPLNSEIYNTGNLYLNKAPILSNNVPSVEIASPILPAVQQQDGVNGLTNSNLQINPYSSLQNSLHYNNPTLNISPKPHNVPFSSQSNLLQIPNSQIVYPQLLPNNIDVGIQSVQPNNIPALPIGISQPLVSENQVLVNQNIQNDLPLSLNIPLPTQLPNRPTDFTSIENQNIPVNIPQKPIEPIVTKDIYFHVAPPEFEDNPVPVLPPKKSYKIIFIKLPSQERKNSALIQSIYNNYVPREDKTLIYVLVKKPEEPKVIVPVSQPNPSEHEVIFVKYKNKESSGKIISQEEEQKRLDDSTLLKPGLVNSL